jgi:HTH-type transcriptional regulator/antitoxin HipB
MDDFDLGALVKDHRKKAGLTQLELANLAGVGKTTVFDIEKNKETAQMVEKVKVGG